MNSALTGNIISAILVLSGFLYIPTILPAWVAIVAVFLGLLLWCVSVNLEVRARMDNLLGKEITQAHDDTRGGRRIA